MSIIHDKHVTYFYLPSFKLLPNKHCNLSTTSLCYLIPDDINRRNLVIKFLSATVYTWKPHAIITANLFACPISEVNPTIQEAITHVMFRNDNNPPDESYTSNSPTKSPPYPPTLPYPTLPYPTLHISGGK